MSIGAAIQPDDGEVYAVVCACDLGIAFRRGCDGEGCCSCSQGAGKFTSRDHVSSSEGSLGLSLRATPMWRADIEQTFLRDNVTSPPRCFQITFDIQAVFK